MIKLENFEVMGWEHAIRGMRNPMNSWEKSDSEPGCEIVEGSHRYCRECDDVICIHGNRVCGKGNIPGYVIGPNDHELMMKLANAGDDHGKVIRYLDVYVDITAPLYFWKEFRTYRKGRQFMDDGDDFLDPDALEMHIETNSCSTMHKIHDKEFTREDFSYEHLISTEPIPCRDYSALGMLDATVYNLNKFRDLYLETKDKKYWWQMIQLLPSSYNQKRTVKLNYQVLKNMYHARKNHKLDEWVDFCKWIESLPYSEIITGEEDK